MTPLEQDVENLFILARSIEFEDGYDDDFRRGIHDLIAEWGPFAIQRIGNRIANETKHLDIAGMALRYMGDCNDPDDDHIGCCIKNELIKGLNHSSYQVRDGAGLGLDSLGDTSVIPALQEAIECEPMNGLKKDLQQVLNQLIKAKEKRG